MSNDAEARDDFVERVARPLRAAEHVDATFEARVLTAVRAEAKARQNRWTYARTLRVTPLAALAAALAFAAVVLAAEAGVRRFVGAPPGVVAGSADTVYVVRFVLRDPSAQGVVLVGSFNQWRKDATPLRVTGVDGTWAVSVILPPGRHEYAFVVSDGTRERWIADPIVPAVHDEYGTESSVLSLARRGVD